MSMTIQAASTRLPTATSGTGSNGSAAEHAYREAVKELGRAQQTLAKHAAEGADEKVLDADKAAVQLAAAAVARAAAAVEAEKTEARRQVEERRDTRRETPTASAALHAVVAAIVTIDVYT